MKRDVASIRREFAALSDALAELRSEIARHGEERLAASGWWPVDRRRKADKLGLLEARIESMRDVVRAFSVR